MRGHGPLILHSAFVFESMLAHLKRLFHGTRGIPDQICRKLAISQHTNQIIYGSLVGNEKAAHFVEQVLKTSICKLNFVKLDDGIKFFAPLCSKIPQVNSPIEGFPADISSLTSAQRMLKNGQVYHSLKYVHRRKSVSYLVQFEDIDKTHSFGKIEYFLKDGNVGFAVLNVYSSLHFNICERNLPEPRDPVVKEFWSQGFLGCAFTAIKKTEQYKLVKCRNICSRVILVKSNEAGVDGYMSSVLRSYQHD